MRPSAEGKPAVRRPRNRLRRGGRGSSNAANRLTTSLLGTTQLTTFTYSTAGEMTGEQCDYLGILSTFVYDGEHRCLNELRASGANHTYAYGSDGLRRSAHMGGAATATTFIWDGTDVLNEYANGALSARYDVLDGEVIAEKRGASRYVYGVDPLGSVVHLLDSGLNRAATYVYWPYGEVQSHTGVDTPMQYVGRLGYYTSTTNRVYVRARWLRPDLARWMTEDPIGFAGGDWNLYGYVRGTVLSLSDPPGTYPRSRCVGNPRRQREMEEAAERMCRQLESAGRNLLEQSQCLTGPKQVQCLLDWCRHGSLNCGDLASCSGRCAYVPAPRGCRFRTDGTVYICPGAWTDGRCWSAHPACNTIGLEPMILHEAINLCGSGQHGGPPSGDAAGNRANCLCAAHLVHRAW